MLQDSYGYYHIRGCVHMHTLDSDGTKTHEEIAAIAADVGLDFLLVTDHMTLRSRASQERFHGSVFIGVGYEHNDPADKNHYLLFETPGVYDGGLSAREYVAQGARDGAIGIIAHPDEARPQEGEWPPYEWSAWDAEGYTGIELWNHMSEWMEALAAASFPGRVALLFSPRRFLDTPPVATLKRWDDANRTRKVVGIAGPDAHGFPYRLGPKKLTIFPYKVHFRTLRTHLILKEPFSNDPATARRQIYYALREANAYISNNRRGPAHGFSFIARRSGQGADQTITCGESFDSPDGVTLEAHTPRPAHIRLLHNGSVIASADGDTLTSPISNPGLYRIEALRQGKGWIYSNHIRIAI